MKNLQGDIIAITDKDGETVARYTYDAWGKCEVESSSKNAEIAHINPFRYRGYYYDRETNLYYLQSRYYDAEVGRFVNSDMVEFAVMQQGAVEHNLFGYCGNEPINFVDSDGRDAIWLQDMNTVVGAGHTGLLLQDKNRKWWHFYWGTNRSGLKGKSGNGKMLLAYSGKIELSSINKFYYKHYNKKYERMLLFKGDFSASVNYASGLSVSKYDLILNNCMQVSAYVLSKGRFSYSDWEYKSFLLKIRKNLIPNVAYSKIANFHSAVTLWNNSSQKLRRYLTSPGEAVNKF